MKDKWPRSWGYIKWLYPNLKIKRWFMLAVGGIFLFATGFAVMNDGLPWVIGNFSSGRLFKDYRYPASVAIPWVFLSALSCDCYYFRFKKCCSR